MENNIIKVNNTSYSIEDKWFEIAKKFFEVDDNNELDISLLKTGLFGYNNEIMSNEIKNNVYHRNAIYDEHFLNTASIPKSIYNFAKVQNTEVSNAIPSHMRVNFSLKKSDITSSSLFRKVSTNDNLSDSDSSYEFIIEDNYVFNLGDYEFRLPYPVQMLFKPNSVNREYSVVARYMTESGDFPFFNIKSPYIKLWEASVGGVRYIFLSLDIFQMEKKDTTLTITNEDISENLFYNLDYTGQLSFFNIYYNYEGEKVLLKKYFNNTFNPDDEEKFYYYSYTDNNKIEISFSALPNSFRPRINSTLEIEIYTTLGNEGNFKYEGNITTSYIESSEMTKIPVLVTPITDASGGKDKPEPKEIKNKLIQNYLYRDNLITESDLNLFFNDIDEKEKINDSSIKFIKKQNDVIKRLFNAYILLKDVNNKVIPSKTIPELKITKEELENNNYTINENSSIIYDIKNNNYFVAFHKLEAKEYLNNENYLVYSIPYLIKIERNPYLSSYYYKTYKDEDIEINYKYINPSIPYQFNISSFNVNRDNVYNETYKFQVSLNTNVIEEDFDSNVKIRAVLKSKNGEKYGYFDLNKLEDSDMLYEGYLATEKFNSITNNKMNIYNSLYSISSVPIKDNNGFTSVKNALIDSDVDIDLYIMYKNQFSKERVNDSINMPDMEEFATVSMLSTSRPISLFENLSNVIESNVFPNENGFTLKSVPLIEYIYFQANYKSIYEIIEGFSSSIRANIDKLENNTDIDIKFYNTHGKSMNYYGNKEYINTTNSYKFNNIDRIDLDLNLNIYVNNAISSDDDKAIKKYISDFIESCNKENVFPVSNLFRRLEENFEIIRFIELNSVNNKNMQKIENKYSSFEDMTKKEIINYVPEYLNIRKNLSYFENEEYIIEQSFDYAITINYI
ncbi:hypothetical protein Bp8pS_268 [Bacillus phage vB_BpuM-BpSp]|nr:hypothetical protein Bp8pS_268 [Bacillus phage vB_BpuM-BpSp]